MLATNLRLACCSLLGLFALSLAACSGNPQPPKLESLVIGSGAPQVFGAVGVPHQLAVSGTYSDGTVAVLTTGVTWSSTDQAIAIVDDKGLVAPFAKGTTDIVATSAATGIAARVAFTTSQVVTIPAGSPVSEESVGVDFAYFRITGLTPGTMYSPGITHMKDDVDLYVFGDAAFGASKPLCVSATIGLYAESCVAAANAAGELWLAVDGTWTQSGAAFTLEAPATTPITIAASLPYPSQFPYLATIGAEERFYKVTGLSPGTKYEFSITNLSADIDIEVFADVYRSATLCESYNEGLVDDACAVTAPASGVVYVELDGQTSANGGSFHLNATPK